MIMFHISFFQTAPPPEKKAQQTVIKTEIDTNLSCLPFPMPPNWSAEKWTTAHEGDGGEKQGGVSWLVYY